MMMGHCNFASTSYSFEPRSLRLKFSTEIFSPVLTGQKIKGSGSESKLEIILVDNHTGQIVTSGPEAQAKVDLVLLKKDFATSRSDDYWTPEEFDNNVVTDWKNKKGFLTGDVQVELTQGRALVGAIKFKHDRHYASKFKFRLGARVVGNFTNVRIKEAKTDPFDVMDWRNALNKKNGPPSLTHKVWRLKKIGKKGPVRKCLEEANITTVKDFLDWLSSDIQGLQKIYGSSGRNWETTVRHARECSTAYDQMVADSHLPNNAPNPGADMPMVDHNVEAHPCNFSYGVLSSNNILTDQATYNTSTNGQDDFPFEWIENIGPYLAFLVGDHEDFGINKTETRRRWTKLRIVWSFINKVGEAKQVFMFSGCC